MTERPRTTCVTCRHCSQEEWFPVCLENEVPPSYEGVRGVNLRPRFWLCCDVRPERGECGGWLPIPKPSGWMQRIAYAVGLHPWLWGRRAERP
jgi:hypothetical protein